MVNLISSKGSLVESLYKDYYINRNFTKNFLVKSFYSKVFTKEFYSKMVSPEDLTVSFWFYVKL